MTPTTSNNPGAESLRIDTENAAFVKECAAEQVNINELKITTYNQQGNICDRADKEDLSKMVTLLQAQNEILRRIAGRPMSTPPRL